MNNTFNFQRFNLLLKQQWLTYRKSFALYTCLIIAAIIIINSLLVFTRWSDYLNIANLDANLENYKTIDLFTLPARTAIFTIIGIVYIEIISANYFVGHSDQRAFQELTLPNTALEKTIVGLFLTIFLGGFLYIFFYWLIDLSMMLFLKQQFYEQVIHLKYVSIKDLFQGIFMLNTNIELYYLISIIVFIGSFFLLGSIFFKRMHFIYTSLSLAAIFICMFFLMQIVLYYIKTYFVIVDNLNAHTETTLCIILNIITVMLWITTYFRLKEKEI